MSDNGSSSSSGSNGKQGGSIPGVIELPTNFHAGYGSRIVRKAVQSLTDDERKLFNIDTSRYGFPPGKPFKPKVLEEFMTTTIHSKFYPLVGKVEIYGTCVSCLTREDYSQLDSSKYATYRKHGAGYDGSNISIGKTGNGYTRTLDMQYIGGQYTLGSLLRDWEVYLTPTRIAPEEKNMSELTSAQDIELYVLCKLFIPEQLIKLMSVSRPAMLLALLTGHIITPQQDVSLNVNLMSNLAPLPVTWLKYLADAYFTSAGILNLDQIKDYTTRYNILSTYEMTQVIDICKRAVVIIKTYPPASYRLKKIDFVVQDVVDILAEMGYNHMLYPTADNPIKCLLEISFNTTVPYLLHKYNIYPRQPLQISLEPIDENNSLLFYNLCMYTDNELLSFYQPFYVVGSYSDKPMHRSMFVNRILTAYNANPTFSTHLEGACYNDDGIHLGLAERRGDIREQYQLAADERRKGDGVDPFMQYEYQIEGGRRRCFQVSELLLSFRETEYGFEFRDPDWIPPVAGEVELIDPLFDKPMARNFPLSAVQELYREVRSFIKVHKPPITNGPLVELAQHIKDGLTQIIKNNETISLISVQINNHPEWRNDLLIYFSWIFLFAMWIRFWKGPGTPYAVVWDEKHEDSCDYRQRDQHIGIELTVHGNILLKLEQLNPELADYIKKLPYFHYNWITGEATQPLKDVAEELVGTHLLEGIVDKVQLDDFCMAQATDLLSGTAFIYLTRIMNVPAERLDDLLVYVMWLLQNLEKQAIDGRELAVTSMAESKQKEEALATIQQHRSILHVRDPGFIQLGLDFSSITTTGHLPDDMAGILGEDDDSDDDSDDEGWRNSDEDSDDD